MCLLRVWRAVCGRTMFPDHEVSTSQCQVPRMVGTECWRPVTENKGFPGKGLLYWLALKKKKSKLTCTLIHKVCQRDAQWAWVKAIYTRSYTSSNISLLRRLGGERCLLPPWWHEFTLQDPNDRTELITTVVSWLLCVCARTCIQDTQAHTLNILKVKIVEKLTRRWQMSQYSGSTEGDALL